LKRIFLITFALLSVAALANTDNNVYKLPQKAVRTIDSLINRGIRTEVFPGCQVVVLHHGEVVFDKCYGYQTYEKQLPVTDSTLYDMASVTKAAATTLAVMKLYDEGKIKLYDTIGTYLPYLRGTDKSRIPLIELLTHTSGMPAFIPFYKKIANKENYIQDQPSRDFSIQIADHCYMRNDYQDSVRHKIAHCKLGAKKYVYSDLNFFFLKEMVEQITGVPMDLYLQENFYQPMGLTHTCFSPLRNGFSKADIAPTERDTLFRHQVVEGYVHDQTAALFDGNAGNAGLFSTAGEIAVIFQMLMDGGVYQGQRYLSEKTVKLFTTTYPIHGCNRRSLGFDTPCFEKPNGVLPYMASNKTYGHQGFTGNVVWCDPDRELVYVFVSNRVYPYSEPNKLVKSKIRLTVHEAVYRGLNIY
jgi:CubicO group peptidase (beta-lactamase class C family)